MCISIILHSIKISTKISKIKILLLIIDYRVFLSQRSSNCSICPPIQLDTCELIVLKIIAIVETLKKSKIPKK